MAQQIAEAIAAGEFDGDLVLLDDALEERSRKIVETQTPAKKGTTSTSAKKVPAPPKRAKSEVLVPTKDATYGITSKFKPLAGAKVKFKNYKADSNKQKSVVEMLTDKPGNPKGKKVVIPTSALVENSKGRK